MASGTFSTSAKTAKTGLKQCKPGKGFWKKGKKSSRKVLKKS